MKHTNLGLPLEYSTLHEYYDVLSCHDHNKLYAFMHHIFTRHKVTSILDLTCGTGAQVLWLAKHGYHVTGSDISPDLLAIARTKAKQENLDVRLIHGDMRTVQRGQYDAAITIFNAIGHLSRSDFEKAIKNIHTNLKSGGLYIFDIFNSQAISDGAVDGFAMDIQKKVGDTTIRHLQHSTHDKGRGLLTSVDEYTIQKGPDTPQKLNHQFTLQIYTAQQLRVMLERNGFETLGHYNLDGTQFKEESSLNILTVAQKR